MEAASGKTFIVASLKIKVATLSAASYKDS